MSDNIEELNKIMYAGGTPDEENGISQGDLPTDPIEDDAWAEPMRDAEGASVDPNFNITYGDAEEDFGKNLKKIYSGELKSSHALKFINQNTDENERFGHEVIFNQDAYPVHEGIHKPTEMEWSKMSQEERTKARYDYMKNNKDAVEKISGDIQQLVKPDFSGTLKLLSSHGVGEYNKLVKKPDIPDYSQEFTMIQDQEVPLAQTIAKVEGTDDKAIDYGYSSGYDVTLGYGKFDPEWFNSKEKSLSDLTVDEVIKLQGAILGHPDNKLNSSALGKWQLTRRTLKDLMDRKVVNLDPTDKFTPEVQDKIFYALLEKRGYSKFKRGELSKEDFLKGLKNEWEGLDRFQSDIKDILEEPERTA